MKKLKKITVLLLAVVMVVTMLPVQSQAASKVQLNKTSTILYVNNKTTLKVSGTSKKAKWSTSNRKVATVTAKGKVTAVKAGTAYISAKISGKKYKCKVKVKNPYLNQSAVSVEYKGKSYLTLTGAKAKSFQSSNKRIATVNSKGVVRGQKKTGKVTITVTDTNKKTYKCTVNVVKCIHNWNGGTVTKAATCTKAGEKTYKCMKCGETKIEEIACIPHNFQWVRTKEPTTTSEGLEEYKCTVCGAVNESKNIAKLPDVGQETAWVYSGNTRTKTMYDGTVVTETKYGTVWGWYDDAAASAMFTEIQNMQRQAYGDANVAPWDDSQLEWARAEVVAYAAEGNSPKAFHMNSGGLPNVSDNRKYITFINSQGLGEAISCFVSDSLYNTEQYTYGAVWRSYFGTYYSSAF